ncbi:hypothetical protein HOE425_340235 [Hoeflea sp. EC-HK425]|nr:hypothetical protein HOE425_340235 [Hoeflea sp. EC-HK425]
MQAELSFVILSLRSQVAENKGGAPGLARRWPDGPEEEHPHGDKADGRLEGEKPSNRRTALARCSAWPTCRRQPFCPAGPGAGPAKAADGRGFS